MLGARTCAMVANEMGEPISRVMISAMSFISAMTCAPALATIAPRSAGLIRGHGPRSKAFLAAATALSMSASVPSGTRPTTSSVIGEMTEMVSVPSEATQSPPMNKRS
jgi:hypothetical protein